MQTMNRYGAMALAAVLATACGSSSSTPTTPAPAGPPNTVTFTAQLSAANEVPPVTNAEANARGTVTITFNLTRDGAGAITAGTATFVYSVSGFTAATPLNLSHIHNGASGVAAGVFVNTGQTAAGGIVTAGDGTINNVTFSNIALTVAQANGVIDNPAGHYFNVHTTLNGGGAVRGQLVRQ